MKVKYLGESSGDLTKGNVYICLGQEYDCYRIIDESKEDYLYPTNEFEIVESDEYEYTCPFYQRVVDYAECYDMFMVAARFFKNEKLVPEKDRDALYKVCLRCGKHGCD